MSYIYMFGASQIVDVLMPRVVRILEHCCRIIKRPVVVHNVCACGHGIRGQTLPKTLVSIFSVYLTNWLRFLRGNPRAQPSRAWPDGNARLNIVLLRSRFSKNKTGFSASSGCSTNSTTLQHRLRQVLRPSEMLQQLYERCRAHQVPNEEAGNRAGRRP